MKANNIDTEYFYWYLKVNSEFRRAGDACKLGPLTHSLQRRHSARPPYPLPPSFLPPLTVSLTQSRPDSSPRWCSDLVLQLVVVDHHGGGDPQHQALAVRETALGVSTSRRGRLCDTASHTAGEIDRWGDIHGRESSISKLFLLDIKLTAILLYLLATIMKSQIEVNDVGESLKGHFGRVIQQGSSILRHFCCDAQSQIIQPPVNKRCLHFNF